MDTQFLFTVADEPETNSLLAGKRVANAFPWLGSRMLMKMPPGSVGILWRDAGGFSEVAQPTALVANPEDHRRLFNRFAHLRSDLSPISSWCHVLNQDRFFKLDNLFRTASLGGFEAAWAGLVVAEATLLAKRSVDQLNVSTCLATSTFAVARACALWGGAALDEAQERYMAAHSLIRQRNHESQYQEVIEPVRRLLLEASDSAGGKRKSTNPIVSAMRVLQERRTSRSNGELQALQEAFATSDHSKVLQRLSTATPEDRVRLFDGLIREIKNSGSANERQSLSFVAGYLTTIMAGGAPSLGMAEEAIRVAPQIIAWAYVIGGIGEQVTWTAGFDGLGRLIVRELLRAFRLDDAPACDFALDEAAVLIDRQVRDPFAHLRIKQGRIVTVSLMPGVNVPLALRETPSSTNREVPAATPSTQDPQLVALVNALMPLVVERLRNEGWKAENHPRRSKPKRAEGPSQSDLPLDD